MYFVFYNILLYDLVSILDSINFMGNIISIIYNRLRVILSIMRNTNLED